MLVTLFVGGCSDPLDDVVLSGDPKSWTESKELEAAIDTLSSEDKEVLGRYMMRAVMSSAFGVDMGQKTVREAIAAQKAFVAEQAAKREAQEAAEKAAQEERQKAIDAASTAVNVSLLSLEFVPSDMHQRRFRDQFLFKLSIRNNTDLTMTGVKGSVQMFDMFGDRITGMDVSIDDSIPPGGVIEWAGLFDFSQFRAEDVRLRGMAFNKIQSSWVPRKIVFSDGTLIDVSKM